MGQQDSAALISGEHNNGALAICVGHFLVGQQEWENNIMGHWSVYFKTVAIDQWDNKTVRQGSIYQLDTKIFSGTAEKWDIDETVGMWGIDQWDSKKQYID